MKESRFSKFTIGLLRWVLIPLLTLLVLPFVPLYRLRDGWVFLWFQSRFMSNRAEHVWKVRRVQAQVRAWGAGGRKVRMCTSRPDSATPQIHNYDKQILNQIQIGTMNCIVELDELNRVLTVEPGMMMGQLTSILTARGWTIPVIPEVEPLTVGGTICGAGVETSSTHWGMPGDSALEFEVVLSSGEVVTCTPDKNQDLFRSIPWSHGTIGFLTAVKFPLLPAKKYVRVEYHVPDTDGEAVTLLESAEHDFVEGILYGRHKFVIMLGDLAEGGRDGGVNHINWWYKPWFYKHVESMLGRRRRRSGKGSGEEECKAPVYVDYIPLRDYYHRHTRSAFWGPHILLPPFTSRLFLLFFGWAFPVMDYRPLKAAVGSCLRGGGGSGSMLYRLVHVMQDFVIPMKTLLKSLDFFEDLVGVYPIWLCPCRMFRRPGMAPSRDPEKESELYIDVGVYGRTSERAQPNYERVATHRAMEDFVMEHGGYQGTYADMFLSREDFRRMFDMMLYDQVRVKYNCLDAFPDVYDKVGPEARGLQV